MLVVTEIMFDILGTPVSQRLLFIESPKIRTSSTNVLSKKMNITVCWVLCDVERAEKEISTMNKILGADRLTMLRSSSIHERSCAVCHHSSVLLDTIEKDMHTIRELTLFSPLIETDAIARTNYTVSLRTWEKKIQPFRVDRAQFDKPYKVFIYRNIK